MVGTAACVAAGLLGAGAAAASATTIDGAFRVGEMLTLDCLNHSTSPPVWGSGPVCKETGRPLSFEFGVDSFASCSWHIASSTQYETLREMISLRKHWACRVPMSKLRTFWLPLYFPLWGAVEEDHFHVAVQYQFVFHVEEGHVIGAAAYPMRSKFQFARLNTVLNMHGAVRFFDGSTFTALDNLDDLHAGLTDHPSRKRISELNASSCLPFHWAILAAWSCSCCLLTAIVAALYHWHVARPRLVQQLLKVS